MELFPVLQRLSTLKLKNETILNFFPEIWYSITFVLWLIRAWNAVRFPSVILGLKDFAGTIFFKILLPVGNLIVHQGSGIVFCSWVTALI